MKALRKEFWMEIRRSKSRFISILLIVALGVAFFSGIQASSPDMRYSGDAYYDESCLMDIKVVGTMGLTEDDVETLGRLFNAYVSCLIGEYLLDEAEIDCLISRLNEIKQNEFKLLFENLEKANEQEHVVRDFLNPHFEAVITQRTQFMLPSPDCIIETMAELVEEDIEVQTDAR